MSDQPWSELINCWFGETLDDPATIPGRMGWWFSADEERDQMLSEEFGELVTQSASGRFGQ